MPIEAGQTLLHYRLIEKIDAVSRAHRAGITHRDLKPDNVMIDAEPAAGARLRPGQAPGVDRIGRDDSPDSRHIVYTTSTS